MTRGLQPWRWLWSAAFVASCLTCAAAQSNYEALSQKAVDAERRGDFATAVSAFQELIRAGADSPELRSNLGIAYYQLREFTDALRQFRVALAKTPDSIPANLFSGLSLLKLHRPKEALPYLETAHRAQPDSSETILALAEAEVASNEISLSRASYEEATRLDPKNAEAWYGLGITERALAEQELKNNAAQKARALMDASEASMTTAIQLDPNSVRALMLLGESFRIAERYDEAVREYKTATEQQPNLAPAWAGLATAYSAAGDDENALKAANRALALDPNDADTNTLIAGTFLRQSDYVQAAQYAFRALKLQPALSSARIVLAKVFLAEHNPQKALPELQSAVKDDMDGSTYYLLATTLRQLGRRDDATAAMQKYRRLHDAHVTPMASSR